jgi:hypothetical protein
MALVSSDSEHFHFLAFLSLVRLLDPILDQLVKNPIFHRVYLHNYNESRVETFTTCTLICILNTIAISPSESL